MTEQPEDPEQPLGVPAIHRDDQLIDQIVRYSGDDPLLRICRDFAQWARRGTE